MDNDPAVREFLRTRRDRITPAEAGIIGGTNRRVPGLRREEVAFLAGVSVDYYARLERGNLAGASDEVLAAIADVLRLDEAEIAHLNDLARRSGPTRRRTRTAQSSLSPTVGRFLDSITGSPVWILNERTDYVAGNALGRAVFAPVLDDAASRGNNARFAFLSPSAREFYRDWKRGADDLVGSLRLSVGRHPRDRELSDLIGELCTRSEEFARRWATHNVRQHHSGVKRLRHPLVGDLDLPFEGFILPEHPRYMMFAFTAEAGSPTAERLILLGSLTAETSPRAAHNLDAGRGRE